jgi:hypothetical protein
MRSSFQSRGSSPFPHGTKTKIKKRVRADRKRLTRQKGPLKGKKKKRKSATS